MSESTLNRVASINREDLLTFLRAHKNAVVLLGTSAGVNFLLPIAHKLTGLYGAIAFAYLRLPDLADRAWALQHVAEVLRGRRVRAARRGYYLFIQGRAAAFHPGLYDPALARDLDRVERLVSAARQDDAVRLFQRVARLAAQAVVSSFGAPLAEANPDAPCHSNPYQILGVRRGAPLTEIRTAYRRLLREHHPDLVAQRNQGEPGQIEEAQRRTQSIVQAYRALAGRT